MMKKSLCFVLMLLFIGVVKSEQESRVSVGNNLFPDNGYFSGAENTLPSSWRKYKKREVFPEGNGLTSEFVFEKSEKVLRVSAFPEKAIQIQSMNYPLPKSGELEFSIWARAGSSPSIMKVYMLGDKYKWNISKRFNLSENWRKYTVKARVPSKIKKSPFMWCRIDIPKKQSILIGRVSLKYLKGKVAATAFKKYPANISMSRNLITNPGFDLGYWGWGQYRRTIRKMDSGSLDLFYNGKLPSLSDDAVNNGKALYCAPLTCLTSYCFPVSAGKKYTLSLYLKRAVPGKLTNCKVFFLANNYKWKAAKFNLTDEWKRYSFPIDWIHHSLRNDVYVRIDTYNSPILVDNVQVEEGKLTDFTSIPVQLGLIVPEGSTSNIFSNSDSHLNMILKAVCRKNVKGKLLLKLTVSDAWGKNILTREFRKIALPEIAIPVDLHTGGIRGTFHVQLEAFRPDGKRIGYGESRFAVCKDLSGIELPDNPIAGHFRMIAIIPAETDRMMPLIKKFFPINDFNRCFLSFNKKACENPETLSLIKKTFAHWNWAPSIMRIMCMLNISDFTEKIPHGMDIMETDVLSADNIKDFKQAVKQRAEDFKETVDAWELINEPSLWRIKSGKDKGKHCMGPEKTARLYQAAREVLKEVAPNVKLIGPAIPIREFEWVERFLKAGGGKYIDIFTYHGYCDNPDIYDTYGKIIKTRELLRKYGLKNIKICSTEQYFGARIPILRAYEKEYRRHYFSDFEINTAEEELSNLIHHAAAGSRVSMFNFGGTVFCGLRNEYFIYDFLAVANAAAELLGTAGTGKPVPMGSALKCFLFPEAKDGPLATIRTVNVCAKGSMQINGEVKAFDMMGNPLSGKTLPLTHSIVYLRFPKGEGVDEVESKLSKMLILGLGKPFKINISMADKDTFQVLLENRLNKTVSGKITIEKYPDAWKFAETGISFSNLKPGKSVTLKFKIKEADFKQFVPYTFKLGIRTERQFFTEKVSFNTLFARYRKKISADGNIDAWKDSEWIKLGKDNTSTVFFPERPWTGEDDLNAKIALAWNEKGLGLAVIVSDNKFKFPKASFGAWMDDSIQLYFDIKNDATLRNKNKADDAEYVISWIKAKTPLAYMLKGPAGRYIGENNKQTGIDREVKVRCRKLADNKLFYDIFLPGVALPMLKFKQGTSLGFSILINDNDGKGRKTGLTTAKKGKQPHGAPHKYMDLILLP